MPDEFRKIGETSIGMEVLPIQLEVIGLDIAQEFRHQIVEGIQFFGHRLHPLGALFLG